MKTNEKRKRRIEYTITMVIIFIVFLVIYLSSDYLKSTMYSNNIAKQPINNIFSREEDPVFFIYDDGGNSSNVIRLYNQFPTTDEVGKALVGQYRTHNFKIRVNERAIGVRYQIVAKKLEKSDFDENFIKLYLEMNGKGVDNCFREDGRIKNFTEYLRYHKRNDERVLYEGVISSFEAKRGYASFTFRMWVSEDLVIQDEDFISQTFLASIKVYASGNV